MKLTEKESLIKNIVFISGLTRSGKSLMCPIISSFKNTEKVQMNHSLEPIPMLNYLGRIDDDTTKFLLQSGVNLAIYENSIGRNSNFRKDDLTSVWKYSNPLEYLHRLIEPDGDIALSKLKLQNRAFPMMVHNGLWHSNIWFDALPNLKIIHMQRNPIEIIFSWMKKGYDGDFYSSDRTMIVTFQHKENYLPYYAFGWEEKYLSLNKVDRIIHMVKHIRTCHQDAYNKLENKYKERILFIRHEKITENPNKYVAKVSNLIGEDASKDTSSILLEENCPRVFDQKEFQRKKMEIQKQSSKEAFNLLMGMHLQFESEELAI